MNAEMLEHVVSMIAILATFGMPVGITFVVKHFKYKHRELDAELEARKMLSERDRVELEKRIERLETIVMSGARPPAADPNARFTNVTGPALGAARSDAELFSSPPDRAGTETAPATPRAIRSKE
jgi:hypothetical protein